MRRFVVPTLAGLAAGSLLAGCPDRSLSKDDPIQDPVIKKSIPVNLNRNIDILFVVDNSGSMGEEQASLTANFPQFINVLSTIPGGLPDVHLGIISTNYGTGGVNIGGCSTSTNPNGDNGLLRTNGCAGITGQYISDIKQPNGTRVQNYTGDLGALFTCMARLGTNGCGFEQPLEATYAALQQTPNPNPGFLRADAYLAIVFITDEDDCSTKPGGAMYGEPSGTVSSPLGPRTSFRCHEFGVECDNDANPRQLGTRTGCRPRANSPYMQDISRYVSYIKSLKTNPKNIVVAGIIGNVDEQATVMIVPDVDDATRPMVGPACTSNSGVAFPGFRLKAFLDQFPERNSITTICNDNLSSALEEVANVIITVIGDPCIDRPLDDRNASTPGVQPECSVADVENPEELPPVRVERVIAPSTVVYPAGDPLEGLPDARNGCGNIPTPCWGFKVNTMECPATANNPNSIAVDVNRGGASVPLGTVLEMQCVTAE